MIIGQWQTSYLKVDFQTYNNSDSLFVFEDKFDKDVQRVAQSAYKKDGTFSAWFLNDKGQKEDETFGTWMIKNDTLFTSYFYLGREIKPSYKIESLTNGFRAISLYDWDNDGEIDDLLKLETKKLR